MGMIMGAVGSLFASGGGAAAAGAAGSSMATYGAIAGGASGLLQGLLGGGAEKKAWAAQETARRKQKIELVKSLNWNEASHRLDLKNLLDQAVDQLTDINFASLRNREAVSAAAAESGMEGRTVNAVKRNVEAQGLRAASRVKENYERDYASILAAREAEWLAGRAQIEGVSTPVKKPSKGGSLLNTLTSTISGAVSGHGLGSRIK